MASFPSSSALGFLSLWLLLCFSSLSGVHAAPPDCEQIIQNLAEECTLPTIVQCEDQPPICTAESTIQFERKCLKCKNKKRKDKGNMRGNTSGGGGGGGNQKVMMPMAAANALEQQNVMTRSRAKAICHEARQELSVKDCQDDIVKCGEQPAICGRSQVSSGCNAADNETFIVCEKFDFIKPKSAGAPTTTILRGSMMTMLFTTTTTTTMLLLLLLI